MDFLEFIEQSNKVKTEKELKNCFLAFLHTVGFDYFTFADMSPGSITEKNKKFNLLSNYPGKWLEYYKIQGYALHDPVYTALCCVRRPTTWAELTALSSDKKAKSIMHEAAENKLVSGIAFPLYGISGKSYGLSISSPYRNLDFSKNGKSLYNSAAAQLLLVYGDITRQNVVPVPALSEREKEILQWIAAGKTKRQIADILFVSQSCIKRHCESIFCKMGVSNLPSAVAASIRLRLICP